MQGKWNIGREFLLILESVKAHRQSPAPEDLACTSALPFNLKSSLEANKLIYSYWNFGG
jgi:hypothetical protein